MNEQDFRERFIPSDSVEKTDKDMNNLEVNSDPLVNKVPVDAARSYETPDRTINAVRPMNETFTNDAPIGETSPYKTPAGETTADESWANKSTAFKTSMGETITHEAPISTNAGSSAALLSREESEHFRTRWNEIQGKFVDEPRSAVQQADVLVSEVVEQITKMFANEHSSLEGQWKQGNDVSTEDLRQALQRYRSFFNRLVV